jgi:hypothetical protein
MADTVKWVLADGTTLTLSSGSGYYTSVGQEGRFIPPYGIDGFDVAGLDGGYHGQVFADFRKLTLPLLIQGTSRSDFLTKLATLANAVDPKKGYGKVRILRGDDAVERELICIYKDGLSFADDGGMAANIQLQFQSQDPFWYSTTPQTGTYTLSSTPALFFPFFPLAVLDSTVFSSATIVNPGDEEAFPIWTITGAGDNISLVNNTTGKTLTLILSLATSKKLYIDTRPFFKTVLYEDGTNYFQYISGVPNLWSLKAGSNSISVYMTNSDANTKIELAYYPRYKGV